MRRKEPIIFIYRNIYSIFQSSFSSKRTFILSKFTKSVVLCEESQYWQSWRTWYAVCHVVIQSRWNWHLEAVTVAQFLIVTSPIFQKVFYNKWKLIFFDKIINFNLSKRFKSSVFESNYKTLKTFCFLNKIPLFLGILFKRCVFHSNYTTPSIYNIWKYQVSSILLPFFGFITKIKKVERLKDEGIRKILMIECI